MAPENKTELKKKHNILTGGIFCHLIILVYVTVTSSRASIVRFNEVNL